MQVRSDQRGLNICEELLTETKLHSKLFIFIDQFLKLNKLLANWDRPYIGENSKLLLDHSFDSLSQLMQDKHKLTYLIIIQGKTDTSTKMF